MPRNILSALCALPLAVSSQAATQTRSIEHIPDGDLQTPYRVERVAGDLRVPWGLTFLPDGRILFTERTGRVRILENGTLLPEPALEIDVAQGNKMGMLGVTHDPEFANNSFIYLAYNYAVTPTNGDDTPPFRLRVVRYRLDGARLVEPRVLIEDIPASVNHTGCRLVFGPDGKLYITTGDADRPPSAQDLNSLRGKILRLNPDGTIPADNPFVDRPGARPEIWSYGHRNPQGLAFDPVSGRLVDTEHGPNGGDEINWIEKGKNYGWPDIDHARTADGMESPVFEFTPSIAPGEALFYRGDAFPELKGRLLVACLRGEGVVCVDRKDGELDTAARLFRGQFGRIRSLTESPEGYLYLTTSQHDPHEGQPRPTYDLVFRIVPAEAPASEYPVMTPPARVPERDLPTGIAGLIERNCAACHGPGLIGGMASGLLAGSFKHAPDETALRKVITEGIPALGMPPNPQLSSADIDAIVEYIRKATRKP